MRRRHFGDDGSVLVVEGLDEVRGHLVWTDGKTHRGRTVPLPPSIAADLHRHLARTVGAEHDALVFTTKHGQPVRLRNFRRLLSEIVHGAGLPSWVTPYTLRHTCASLLARQGVHPTVAADILGHDPAVYLRTYAHLYPEDRALAAAALGGARPAPATAHDAAPPFATARTRSARGESAGTLPSGAK